MTLLDSLLSHDRRALARLITQIENDRPEARAALAALYPRGGRAQVVGITGAPGTGKSTLVNELARVYRRQDRTVAIVAVDPTSPFTGGAILGDRIRMRDLAGDAGVFIRSMATRGSLGGIARASGDVVSVLDAAGFDVVLIETVGAGQSEVEIAQLAQTTVVVEAPGLGDDVQAIKAGILEIADVLVVNKADQPNAEAAVRALRGMLSLGHPVRRGPSSAGGEAALWEVPICETAAIDGRGVVEVAAAVDRHRSFLETSGDLIRRQRERIRRQIESTLRDLLYVGFTGRNGSRERIEQAVEAVMHRSIDPYSAAEEMLK
jgi:LAO/AO transport system kinase